MGHKEKASAKIRELHLNALAERLDEAIKEHYGYMLDDMRGHDINYWDREIEKYTTKVPADERIPAERLKQLLESKVGPLLDNNCVQCGRLVKHLSEKYRLG